MQRTRKYISFEKKNQSIETEAEKIQMIKLVNKDNKTAILNIYAQEGRDRGLPSWCSC